MLRLLGPGCPDAMFADGQLPSDGSHTVWVDLLKPTPDEDHWAEALIGQSIPTREEMLEIEPSSRLFERNGALFLTMSVLYGVDQGAPSSDPISFILTDRHLVTVRYVEPRPFLLFIQQAAADPALVDTPLKALIGLVDAIVDRLADELEASARDMKDISSRIFERGDRSQRRNPEFRYEALMYRIGESQRLLAKIRETSLSTNRMLSFLAASDVVQKNDSALRHIRSLSDDVRALDDHSNFQGDNLTFLLDAALGMISLEQNFVMKIFSVVAVVLMPPTLIAGIYGMNFHFMPELSWPHGYTFALGLMLASAVIPYWLARRRGWL
nr:magnesium transporter CorA family protein [uncultured Sphingomonas sp.]